MSNLDHQNTEIELQDESGITIVRQDQEPQSLPSTAPSLTEEEIQKNKLCQICQSSDWIYTCPRCLVHTCSLKCVKQHKKDASCSGERDKTAYVPLQKYTESHMMSDYTYLEDMSRQSDNITRERMNTNRELRLKGAENRAKVFARSAIQAGVRYSSLPIGMSRNKLNQSNYSRNLKQIFWSIEVNFCMQDKRERYLEHSFPQNKPFRAFFENLLMAENPQGKGAYSTIRHQVKPFVDAGIDQFNIALKKEKAPRGHFINVTGWLDQLFTEVLKGEEIIEYPIFYIWLKSQSQPSDITELHDKKQPLITAIDVDVSSEQQMAEKETDIGHGEDKAMDGEEEEEEQKAVEEPSQPKQNAYQAKETIDSNATEPLE